MLSFNLYCWSALHIIWTPTFGEFMYTGSPQLVELWSCVSSPLLSHTPHRRRIGGSRGDAQRGVRFDLGDVSQLTFWRQGLTLVRSIFIFYFVRLPLCNKYSDYIVIFISTHSVIIYVVFLAHVWDAPTLSLKSRYDRSGIRGMLTVGQNLDRNGQNPYLLTLLWFFLYLSWSSLIYFRFTLIFLTFSF
jgi:hypothetical protein